MDLPVMPPVAPMLARPAATIPDLGHTEPKWDGFRTIVFRDGDEVVIGSRNEKPLTRYFPDLVEAVRAHAPARCVLDGEIVRVEGDRLDFDALSGRIHPAASRVRLLAEQQPVTLVTFDLLALDDTDLTGAPFRDRRARLVDALAGGRDRVLVTPATADLAEAQTWFEQFEGAGLDGVVAKPPDGTYQPGRRAMTKVKHARTADCVVAGYRRHTSGDVVGSLLLGLWTDDGRLQHVGVAASFSMERRRSLLDELAPYRDGVRDHPWAGDADTAGAEGRRVPGAVSRWSAGKDLSFVPLRPELVAEVGYDHLEGDRFRHTTRLLRWRPDREAASCTYAQLEEPVGYRLSEVLRPG